MDVQGASGDVRPVRMQGQQYGSVRQGGGDDAGLEGGLAWQGELHLAFARW